MLDHNALVGNQDQNILIVVSFYSWSFWMSACVCTVMCFGSFLGLSSISSQSLTRTTILSPDASAHRLQCRGFSTFSNIHIYRLTLPRT